MTLPSRHQPGRRLPHFDYADPHYAYFVTLCIQDRHAVFTNPTIVGAGLDVLHWLRTHRDLKVYAYCFMPDHLHLLLGFGAGAGGRTLGDMVRSIKLATLSTDNMAGDQRIR